LPGMPASLIMATAIKKITRHEITSEENTRQHKRFPEVLTSHQAGR
jgi:hypothetical protein